MNKEIGQMVTVEKIADRYAASVSYPNGAALCHYAATAGLAIRDLVEAVRHRDANEGVAFKADCGSAEPKEFSVLDEMKWLYGKNKYSDPRLAKELLENIYQLTTGKCLGVCFTEFSSEG
jgi:hypothetical protein